MQTNQKAPAHIVRYRWTEDFKGNCSAAELKAVILKILAAQGLLECFEASYLFYTQIEVPGRLPLTVSKDERNITIANYFDRDGQQEADPAIDLQIGKDGAWYPIYVHLAYDDRSCIDLPLSIDFEERRKQVSFAAKWAANLSAQGYDQGEVTKFSNELE